MGCIRKIFKGAESGYGRTGIISSRRSGGSDTEAFHRDFQEVGCEEVHSLQEDRDADARDVRRRRGLSVELLSV